MLSGLMSHVNSVDVEGTQICLYEKGAGMPIILLHGMFGDFLDWEPVLEPLSKNYRVLALDLPGFGASAKPRTEYSAEFFVAILHTLLRQRRISEATLVGNSFGAQIAILFALRHPDLVARLVLVDSGGFRQYPEAEVAFTAERFNENAIAALTPEINAFLFSPVFSKPSATSAYYIERQNAKLKRSDYPAYAFAIAQSIRLSMATYLLDRISELRCPVLLIWGEMDPVLPLSLAQQALTNLQNGELKIVPGCGHAPQLECPKEFLGSLLPFLPATEP